MNKFKHKLIKYINYSVKVIDLRNGGAKNVGPENVGLKMQEWKMQHLKIRFQVLHFPTLEIWTFIFQSCG